LQFFSNSDQIKAEATWNDELEKWNLPEFIVARTKLPPPGMYILVNVTIEIP